MTQSLNLPLVRAGEPRLVDFGYDLQPPFGAPGRRISRSARHAVTYQELGSLSARDGRALLAGLLAARAAGDTVSARFPQPALDVAVGAPQVDGASQSGRYLAVKGLPVSQTLDLAGRYFCLAVSGLSYLYAVTANPTTDGAGKATLAISPLLRASPANNASLVFDDVIIEGYPNDMTQAWQVKFEKWLDVPLIITERA